jgi:hypothetical protein
VELNRQGETRTAGYAPYLDYRPLDETELPDAQRFPEPHWLRNELETKVLEHAAIHLVPGHLTEVRQGREQHIAKALAAVKDRLTKEINYWDHRAVQLKEEELAGKVNARLNSGLARQRANDLEARLQKRLAELEQERRLSPSPPVVLGAALVVPVGLLNRLKGAAAVPTFAHETAESERRAMEAVMAAERGLGYEPRDVSAENQGYDLESGVPQTGRLRFLEVKGRVSGARTVTVTRNEILTALNKPDDFILALVRLDGEQQQISYVRQPFENEPDFSVTSVNYDLDKLLARSQEPS